MRIPVCIIGCGPIGLAGALLLAKFGIRSLIVERRGGVNTHPRSRFVDTNTMELMRVLGVEEAVQATGLGADWTACNRWLSTVTGTEVAAIPSPTFHTVPRATSPTMPVMTCQDYVENVLIERTQATDLIEIKYLHEAVDIVEEGDGVTVRLKDLSDDQIVQVQAEYVLGTDGPHSFARRVIGSEMLATPRPQYSQDVIFQADLTAYLNDRKAALLYTMTASGVLVFQPLNGKTRWRCQIFKPDSDMLSETDTITRIREALGVPEVAIDITSMGIWQPTPGCVDRLGKGRIFLAGDAAHVSLPTGGMGNNIGFSGVRNLTWKLAYVLIGWAEPAILDTYHLEHHSLALARIEVGIQTTEYMGTFIRAYYRGEDTAPGITLTQQYGDYDGALLSFEQASALIEPEASPPPAVANPTINFMPSVRCGRRAPHVWLDAEQRRSVLDWFGTHYVLLVGAALEGAHWQDAVASLKLDYMKCEQLPDLELELYHPAQLVLVRPDGVVADRWLAADVPEGEAAARIRARLPR